MLFRPKQPPLRFAHSSGALALDQASRDAMRSVFDGMGQRLTVLQLMPRIEAGGAEIAALGAAEAVALGGGRSIVATAGGPVERLKRIGAEFAEAPLDARGPVAIGRNGSRIKRLIDEYQVDIVHARTREIAWAARQATKGSRAILVTTCGGDAPFNDAGKDAGALGEGDHIIAGSEHVRGLLIDDDSARDGKISVIPDGANLAVYAAEAVGPQRLTTLARAWGMLEEPAPTILAPGPTVPERGKHVLARALGEIAHAPGHADLVAIIPGELKAKDTYAQQLAWIARKRGATGRIFLAGALTDIPAAMMLADIVVSVPVEPLGQDPIAAMAAGLGKPVIGADIGATAEVVVDGVTGRLVPPDDPEALGRAITEILAASAKEKADLSAAARTWALAKFSATGSALAVIRQYAELMKAAK